MSAIGRTRAWVRAVRHARSHGARDARRDGGAHRTSRRSFHGARNVRARSARAPRGVSSGPSVPFRSTARDARGGQWIDDLRRDLKYAFRYFARTPLTTITIVLTLALGIGFSSAVFSVLNGILTRPAPGVPDDPALVKIRGLTDVRPYARQLSYPELTAYAGLTSKFASVVGWAQSGVVVGAGDPALGAISARAYFVTPNYFSTLGIRLAAGRSFDQSRFDERFPPELTAIVSHGFASERFARSASRDREADHGERCPGHDHRRYAAALQGAGPVRRVAKRLDAAVFVAAGGEGERHAVRRAVTRKRSRRWRDSSPASTWRRP